jgi:hypothetical protein
MAYDWTNWMPSALTKDDNNTKSQFDWRIWLPRGLRGTTQETTPTKDNQLTKPSGETVFICYADEDIDKAKRLYKDLKNANLNPWLDKESLRAGEKRRIAIEHAIKKSRYFIPLLSSNSIQKRGFVQRELKEGLDVLKEFPESDIFIIPARLDDCEISNGELEEINYVDMFPSWDEGFEKILSAMNTAKEKQKD